MCSAYALNACEHVLTARVVHAIRRMKKRGLMQSEAERAVHELLERGPLSRERAASYANTLSALVAARVARRTAEGGYELVRDAIVARVPRTEPPPSTRDALLEVTLPLDCIAILDTLAPTREAAIAKALRPYLGSGVWRKR